jgi:molybdenum cofactor synthesis domain-containing protein
MKAFSFAILTVSDRCSRGEREDRSAEQIEGLLKASGGDLVDYRIVADEINAVQTALRLWSDEQGIDLILTTGGTGVHPRDMTPEATRPLLHREIPGMAEAMRNASRSVTPHAMLSRACAGIRGSSLIVNLPGSPKGAVENLEAILPAIPHAIEKIQGDPSDCAST